MRRSSFASAAVAGSLATLLAACSAGTGSTGLQGTLTDQQTQEIGTSVAEEVQTSVSLMTVGSASSPGQARLALPAPGLRAAMVHVATPACPTYSPDPFVDSDGDGVPDDVAISFSPAACTIVDTSTHETLQLSGSIAVQDPTPAVSDLVLLGRADSVTLTLFDQADQEVAQATRSGQWSVAVTGGALDENYGLSSTLIVAGQPTVSALNEWSASYTPDLGTELSEGSPLPPGTLQAAGVFIMEDGTQDFSLQLDTPTPLRYDPLTCSGGVSPFTAGELHATITGTGPVGYVRLVWSDCEAPTATFVQG